LQQIFPSDFTLPEIQRIYEQVLTKELDRRNFRKKFLKLDLIEETGDKAPTATGRPAKLYRFKQDIENVILF
jgi:8-oxo-dGTP diphosphatase